MRKLSFKIWIPVFLVGIVLVMTLPAMHELPDKGMHHPPPINYQALVGEICIGLGSLASIIRGAVEFAHLFKKKEKK